MVITSSEKQMKLSDPYDMTRLHVEFAEGDDGKAWFTGLHWDDGRQHVWFPIEHLRALGPTDAAWQRQFGKMIVAASDHGWVSAYGLRVRAHVRPAPASP